MKRIVSMVLAIALVILCCPLPVQAVDETDITRYSVLILDTSGSMRGTPAQKQKEAAIKFCSSVISADGTNYVAIVKLNSSSSVGCDFTNSMDTLTDYINDIPASGGTNVNQALEIADSLCANINEDNQNIVKNIIVCSDGLPENGFTTMTGPYTTADSYSYYGYANYAYNTANTLKEKYYIYSLGFFHSLNGSNLSFGRKFMDDIQNAGYYEVIDPEDLEFEFGNVADDIVNGNELKEITFTYQSGEDYSATCYYTNEYFANGSYKYNPSLATMSLAFAMSAFNSGNEPSYANKSINAKNLLKDIGVLSEDIGVNDWFSVKPTTDSIGVIIGNMPITVNDEDYTLIALAVRGGGYEQEWASNFTLGISGQHDGFDTAKENVLSYLEEYIDQQDISGQVKFWITGYSRAAATANLVGGALDEDILLSSDITYDYDDIYTYCFETPSGALTDHIKNVTKKFYVEEEDKSYPIFHNIFNIINSSDPVPYVAPAALKFGRYGIDKYLPSAESDSDYTSKKNTMLSIYKSLDSTGEYVVDDFQMKKIAVQNWLPFGEKISFIQDDTKNDFSQGLFLSNYITILSKEFLKSRESYVANYQDEIREICSVVFGASSDQSQKLSESLISQAKDNWGDLLLSYVWNVGMNPWGSEEDALQIVSDWVKTAVKDAGITDYDESMINSAGIKLADLLLALVTNHPNYFTTAVMNISGLGAAHYPELCFAWVASMDENYTSSATPSFNNGSYRIIRINCEVDVDVFDNSGTLVASIVDDTPQSISNSEIISAINEDGEKIIVLPVDVDYEVVITGRADDLVSYGVDEYSALAGDFTRAVDFFDIELGAKEKLIGTVPSYNAKEIEGSTLEGSSVEYTLRNPAGNEIASNSDLSGEDAVSAYHFVTVTSNDPNYGVALGTGVRQYGNFAQVEAAANKGYDFAGWYVDDECVSTDTTYRFRVTQDVSMIARFEKSNTTPDVPHYPSNPSYSINITTVDNGLVSVSPSRAESGDTVTITTTPEKGYKVDNVTVVDKDGSSITVVNVGDGKYAFTQPSSEVTVTVSFVWDNPFTDVSETAWYYDAVKYVFLNGLMVGFPDNIFAPDEQLTRAEVVQILYNLEGQPDVTGSTSFTDGASHWAVGPITWAEQNSIVDGYGDSIFLPNQHVSREEFAQMMYNYAKFKNLDTSATADLTTFPDGNSVAGWAKEAMAWANGNDLINGHDDGRLDPGGTAIRAQAASILMKFDQNLVKK